MPTTGISASTMPTRSRTRARCARAAATATSSPSPPAPEPTEKHVFFEPSRKTEAKKTEPVDERSPLEIVRVDYLEKMDLNHYGFLEIEQDADGVCCDGTLDCAGICDGDTEVGRVGLEVTGGHTGAHQLLRIHSGDLQAVFGAKNTAILGVSFDSAADNAGFHEKFRFNYPLLCDTDRTMGLAYGAASEPGTGGYAKRVGVIIDTEGNISHYDASVSAGDFPNVALGIVG